MSKRRSPDIYQIFDAKAANGTSTPIYIGNARHKTLVVATTAATLTLKVKGAISKIVDGVPNSPNFSAASAVDNEWTYIEIVNLDDRTDIVIGSTGIAFTSDTSVSAYKINLDSLDWIALEVASRSAGSVDARLALYED
jgi:hypothetical protein